MSSVAYVTHATCLLRTQTYILMSAVTARLFPLMITLLLPPLYSLLPLLLFVLPGGELYPATLRLFVLTHPSTIVIEQANSLSLYLLRSYSTRYRYFQLTG